MGKNIFWKGKRNAWVVFNATSWLYLSVKICCFVLTFTVEQITSSFYSLFFNSAKTSTYPKRKVEHEYIDVADVENHQYLSSQGGKRLPETEGKKVRLWCSLVIANAIKRHRLIFRRKTWWSIKHPRHGEALHISMIRKT